jgi:hypothetical protein
MVAAEHHLAILEELCTWVQLVHTRSWEGKGPYLHADFGGEGGELLEAFAELVADCCAEGFGEGFGRGTGRGLDVFLDCGCCGFAVMWEVEGCRL